MKLQINTGRQYTSEGQVIVIYHNDKSPFAFFQDHSRMITGAVRVASDLTAAQIKFRVMYAYDAGLYINAHKNGIEVSFWDAESGQTAYFANIDLSRE